VLIQRPLELDTAYVLAKLQEEVALPPKKRDFCKIDYPYQNKQDVPTMPYSQGYSKADKISLAIDDRRSADTAQPKSVEDKWAAVKVYRRAQGLCQRCAEKWTKDHHCADKV
jgi:hypothetical protein